jgi:hypothetical protein
VTPIVEWSSQIRSESATGTPLTRLFDFKRLSDCDSSYTQGLFAILSVLYCQQKPTLLMGRDFRTLVRRVSSTLDA